MANPVDFTPGGGGAQLPGLPQPIKWLITGAVRHAIVGFGAVLLSQHILSTTAQQTAFNNWGTDTVLVVAGLAWSFLNHKAQAAASTS